MKSMSILIILLSGDIQINPGPNSDNDTCTSTEETYPCGVCDIPVLDSDKAIDCDECGMWLHINCIGITNKEYKALHNKSFQWICFGCSTPNFSGSFFDDSVVDLSNSFSSLDDQVPEDDIVRALPDKSATGLGTGASNFSSNCRNKSRTKKHKKLKIMTANCQGLKGKVKQKNLNSYYIMSSLIFSLALNLGFPLNIRIPFFQITTLSGEGTGMPMVAVYSLHTKMISFSVNSSWQSCKLLIALLYTLAVCTDLQIIILSLLKPWLLTWKT